MYQKVEVKGTTVWRTRQSFLTTPSIRSPHRDARKYSNHNAGMIQTCGKKGLAHFVTYHVFRRRLVLRLEMTFSVTVIDRAAVPSSSSWRSRLIEIGVRISTLVCTSLRTSRFSSCLTSVTSFLTASLSENALKSAVNKTLWAHPASFPHSFRNLFPIAS